MDDGTPLVINDLEDPLHVLFAKADRAYGRVQEWFVRNPLQAVAIAERD